jgi:catechol 2,3-dioxygenase
LENKFFEKPAIYVEEVSINVMDLERSLAFYCDFMGFNVLEKTERTAVLTSDGKTAILRLEQP